MWRRREKDLNYGRFASLDEGKLFPPYFPFVRKGKNEDVELKTERGRRVPNRPQRMNGIKKRNWARGSRGAWDKKMWVKVGQLEYIRVKKFREGSFERFLHLCPLFHYSLPPLLPVFYFRFRFLFRVWLKFTALTVATGKNDWFWESLLSWKRCEWSGFLRQNPRCDQR